MVRGLTQPTEPEDRIGEGDSTLIVVPWIGHEITINEVHAMLLGTVGALLGLVYVSGSSTAALSVTLLLVAYAILGDPAFEALGHDDPEYEHSIGMKTIKHEPWYFLAVLVTTFVLVAGALELGLALVGVL